MGPKIVHVHLPALLQHVGYHTDQPVKLVLFSSDTFVFDETVGSLPHVSQFRGESTRFAGSVRALATALRESNDKNCYRVFVLTDGEIFDRPDVIQEMQSLSSHGKIVEVLPVRFTAYTNVVDTEFLAMLAHKVGHPTIVHDWRGGSDELMAIGSQAFATE